MNTVNSNNNSATEDRSALGSQGGHRPSTHHMAELLPTDSAPIFREDSYVGPAEAARNAAVGGFSLRPQHSSVMSIPPSTTHREGSAGGARHHCGSADFSVSDQGSPFTPVLPLCRAVSGASEGGDAPGGNSMTGGPRRHPRHAPSHFSTHDAGKDVDVEQKIHTEAGGSEVIGETDTGTGSKVYRRAFTNSFLKQNYVEKLPPHLMPLAQEIHDLDPRDLIFISEITQDEAKRDVYSLLPYTGGNWFLPYIRECEEGEAHWGLWWSWENGIIIALGGRRLSIRLLGVAIRACFIVLTWFMLWCILPHKLMQPGGYVWDPLVLVVVSAIVGGFICRILQIPPLVGVLWIGIMWNNIPTLHYLTAGIVPQFFSISSKLGLTVILARAGYSLSIKGIRPHWIQSMLLSTLPFACEGVAHSLIANKVFDYDNNYDWAFLQGMLCSVVSPAVVVPGALYLQEMGYGRGVGSLSLMLSSVGVEIVIGVWCANFLLGLIFEQQKLAVAIVLGPVQFIGGAIIGILIGFIYFYVVEILKREAYRLPSGKYHRTHFNSTIRFSYVIFLFICFTMVFLGYGVNLAGGGCVMCVLFSATVAHLWLKDEKAELEQQKRLVGGMLAFTWDEIMLPLLFATMGAKISIKAIFNSQFFPKAIICLVSSNAVRIVVTFLIQLGSGMPWKEKLLTCVGYLGKASAQASIGPIAASIVLAMINALPPGEKPSPQLLQMQVYANNVQQMAAMYVMFMAAIASVGLVRGGMLVLPRDATGKESKDRLKQAMELAQNEPRSAFWARESVSAEEMLRQKELTLSVTGSTSVSTPAPTTAAATMIQNEPVKNEDSAAQWHNDDE